VEDDRVDIAALGPELPFEQIAHPLGLRSRQSEDLDIIRPYRVSQDRAEDRDGYPRHHDTGTVNHAPAGKPSHQGALTTITLIMQPAASETGALF
jgi:hypothetical protein